MKEKRDNEAINIRLIQPSDYPLLVVFLYLAIFLPPGAEPPPKKIVFQPDIYIYIKDFGGDKDIGVIAEQAGKVIGAAWTRIIPAFGHFDDNTPELAISVLPQERSKGVGTKMMLYLFEQLREQGFQRTSLSVQKDNPAVKFYERLGYTIISERLDSADNEDYLMLKDLISIN